MPPDAAAASFVPSAEDVIDVQAREPDDVLWVQVAPESVEVKMKPNDPAAASFVPSVDDVIDCQKRLPEDVRCAHVAPESVEV